MGSQYVRWWCGAQDGNPGLHSAYRSICSFGAPPSGLCKVIHPEQNAPSHWNPFLVMPEEAGVLCAYPCLPAPSFRLLPLGFSNENVLQTQPKACKAIWKCSSSVICRVSHESYRLCGCRWHRADSWVCLPEATEQEDDNQANLSVSNYPSHLLLCIYPQSQKSG